MMLWSQSLLLCHEIFPSLKTPDVRREHLVGANVAIQSLGGKVWPAQNDCEATGVNDSLGSDPLDLLSPAGALCLASDGQALEWVRLEGPGHVAHCAHDGELPGSLGLGGGTDGSAGDDGRHIGLS